MENENQDYDTYEMYEQDEDWAEYTAQLMEDWIWEC